MTGAELLVEQVVAEFGVAPAAAYAELEHWGVIDIVIRGELAGAVMQRGPEVHVAIAPAWRHRAIQRHRLQAMFVRLFFGHQYLTTRVFAGSEEQNRFVKQLGFTLTWSDGRVNYYMLTSMPLRGKRT